MLKWTQTLPGMGKLTKTKLGQDRFISWRYLLDQPATRLTAVFLAHLSFSYAYAGMAGVAQSVQAAWKVGGAYNTAREFSQAMDQGFKS